MFVAPGPLPHATTSPMWSSRPDAPYVARIAARMGPVPPKVKLAVWPLRAPDASMSSAALRRMYFSANTSRSKCSANRRSTTSHCASALAWRTAFVRNFSSAATIRTSWTVPNVARCSLGILSRSSPLAAARLTGRPFRSFADTRSAVHGLLWGASTCFANSVTSFFSAPSVSNDCATYDSDCTPWAAAMAPASPPATDLPRSAPTDLRHAWRHAAWMRIVSMLPTASTASGSGTAAHRLRAVRRMRTRASGVVASLNCRWSCRTTSSRSRDRVLRTQHNTRCRARLLSGVAPPVCPSVCTTSRHECGPNSANVCSPTPASNRGRAFRKSAAAVPSTSATCAASLSHAPPATTLITRIASSNASRWLPMPTGVDEENAHRSAMSRIGTAESHTFEKSDGGGLRSAVENVPWTHSPVSARRMRGISTPRMVALCDAGAVGGGAPADRSFASTSSNAPIKNAWVLNAGTCSSAVWYGVRSRDSGALCVTAMSRTVLSTPSKSSAA